MGLASSLSTALTGLSAAETTIDVVGNNLANSNTVGFKASQANFATQFLQTLSLGSAPTTNTGGTNPRQTGLGTMVAEITPDFKQGTVEISSNPMDMAIQGDGFFIMQGASNEQLYTRNGIFKLNSQNEIVAITGQRLLGFGVDDRYQIQTTTLEPITIPLGQAAVAQATQNVYLEGTLSPTGDLATRASIIQTDALGDSTYIPPVTTGVTFGSLPNTPTLPTVVAGAAAGGLVPGETYNYRFVYYNTTNGSESSFVQAAPFTPGAGVTSADLSVTGAGIGANYDRVRIYRTLGNSTSGTYYQVTDVALGAPATHTDIASNAAISGNPIQKTALLNNTYNYYVTYVDSFGNETAPQATPLTATAANSSIQFQNLPAPPAPSPAGPYVSWRIYRNYPDAGGLNSYRRVAEVPFTGLPANQFVDSVSDAYLATQTALDFVGKKATSSTLLTSLRRYSNGAYETPFQTGTLEFTGRKGGRALAGKNLTITSTTTTQELAAFMQQAMGIQSPPGPDPANPIPPSQTTSGTVDAGISIINGRFYAVGNNGAANAIEVSLSGMQLTPTGSNAAQNVNMPFSSVQTAVGESAVTDFLVYDSLGIALRTRVTAVLESRSSTATTFRWFADSADNSPVTGVRINVGTGLLSFDGEGKFISSTNANVSIDRVGIAAQSPLDFKLDFSKLSGLAATNSSLAASRQDGSAPGVLTSFIVGEDGRITGVFSNGVTRDLAQVQLARFANPNGLSQRGQNMFAAGVNSGLPIQGGPGQQGIGTIVGGAVELSNTDIGGNLIDLILASTMYRGNTRVITTVQQMFDELLSLRR